MKNPQQMAGIKKQWASWEWYVLAVQSFVQTATICMVLAITLPEFILFRKHGDNFMVAGNCHYTLTLPKTENIFIY